MKIKAGVAGVAVLVVAVLGSVADPASGATSRGARGSDSRCATVWEFEQLEYRSTRAEVEALLDWEGVEGVSPSKRDYRACGHSWSSARVVVAYRAGRVVGAVRLVVTEGRLL